MFSAADVQATREKIMHLKEHLAASAAVSAGVYAATKSSEMAVWSFLAGFLLDLDHLIDYWFEYSFNVDIRGFFRACHECDFKITRVYFHSLEALMFLCAASYFTRSVLITAVTLGITQHMVFDQVINKVYPASYFFIYRWLNGFKSTKVFTSIKIKDK
jgi:hypothetical protein